MTPKRLLEDGAKNPGEQGAAELLEQSGPMTAGDDLAKERVWRALQKSLPESKKQGIPRWVFATAAVAAAAALVIFFAPIRTAERAGGTIELTAGQVLTSVPGGSWTRAEAGNLLPPASRVKTDATARALINISRSAVLVSPDSDVALESLGKQTFVRLTGGDVLAEVEHRASDESFVVQTTRYKVTVKGTVFSVRERAADDVTVSVSRGLVEVSGEGGTWLVAAGKSWNSRSPDSLSADEIGANDRALVASISSPAPRALIRVEGEGEVSEGGMVLGPAPVTWVAPVGQYHFTGPGTQAADATTATDHPATVQLKQVEVEPEPAVEPAPEPLPEPHAALPPPARHHDKHKPHHEPKLEEKPVARADETPSTPEIEAPPPEQHPSTATGLDKPAPPPPPASTDAYGDALKLERDGHYDEAAQLLAKAVDAHNARSHTALYELGRLQQLNHQPAQALQTFARYEREYPNGVLIQEAELSVIEIELQQHAYDDALANMNSFLSRHADSERASEIHLRRADVLRARGDCAKAIDDYALAKAPKQADDAMYFTAWCEQKMGERDDAEKSLRKYLERFPAGRHAKEAKDVLGEKF